MSHTKAGSSASKSIILSFYTFLSRILGLLRDHYMATTFGTGLIASAFSVAYRLPNMFRNLLAEGTLSQSFMPLYSESKKQGESEARFMAGAVLTFLSFLLAIFVGIFILSAPYFIPTLVGNTQEYYNLVIKLSAILFFLIMTASLSSIFMAISNTDDKFFVPSLSPIILNFTYLFILIVVFRFVAGIEKRIFVLSYGIILGGLLQLLVQAGYVFHRGAFPKLNFHWRHPAIKKIGSLMLPAIVGGGFYQISLLVDIFLANYIQNQNPGLGAVVSLDYSQRLVQFPTGIIGVALATTTLPTLLSALRRNAREMIPDELVHVLSFSLFLTLPSTLGFFILGRLVVDSIFFGGRWGHESTNSTLMALQFYCLAIPMYSMNKVLISSYYAFQDTRHPLKINGISFAVNLLLNLVLIHTLKHAGLALSSAVSASLTFSLLLIGLKKHQIQIPHKHLSQRVMKMIPPLVSLGLLAYCYRLLLHDKFLLYCQQMGLSHASSSRFSLATIMIPAILLYFLISFLVGSEDLQLLLARFTRRSKKNTETS